jgi:hypothetical protein
METKTAMTEVEAKARLKESIVIIRLMYEDLVKNDIASNARRIAGGFLYSQGYEQLVKELDKK